MTDVAPEAFRTVGQGDEIPDDSIVPFPLDDQGLRLAVARVDGDLYAFDEVCTHAGCPLSGGALTGTTITCQCHGSRFDLTNGAVINGPATKAITVYEVQEVDGRVDVRV